MIARLIVVSCAMLACIACADNDRLPPAELASLMDGADSLHLRGEFDSARTAWSRALAQSRKDNIAVAEGRALTGLGLASYRLGNYDTAQKELEAALKVQRDAKLAKQLAKTYNGLGLVAYQQGRLISAAAFYDSSTTAASSVNDEQGVAKAAGNLALVQVELGEFTAARAGFEKMRAAGERLDDARFQGNALNNIGMLDIKLGNSAAALTELAEARRLFRSIDYKTGEQNNLGQLATAYAATGDYGRAFAVLDTALAMCRKLKLRQEEASNLEILATLHQKAGDPKRALRLFSEAQKINRELDLSIEQGANAKDRALIERDNGRADAATRLAEEALAAHRKAEARFEELNDLLLLAELAQKRGADPQSKLWLKSADSVAHSIDVPMAYTRVALGRARVSDMARDWPGVISSLQEGPASWNLAGYTGLAEGYTLRARAYANTGALNKAIADGRKAIEAVSRLRSSAGSLEMRARIAATYSSAYSDLVDALVRAGSVDAAFEVADASKGNTLMEYVQSGSPSSLPNSSGIAKREGLLKRLGQLELRRTELSETKLNHNDSVVLARIDAEVRDARSEYEDLMSRSSASPDVIGGTGVRARDIQASLGTNEALVEFHLAPDKLHIFVVTREVIRHVERRESIESLAGRIRLADDQLQTARINITSPVLAALYQSVIAPVDTIVRPGATLIIVSHGVARRIPFAALRNPRGDWLITLHPLLHIGSGGSLKAVRSASPAASASLAASIFVPLPDKLPGTTREAAAVSKVVSGSRSYVGRAATEAALRSALSKRGIVHVATHGELNDRNPAFSRVDLFPVQNAHSENDGRLEAHELIDTQLAADLVFLSGCETAAGVAINPFLGGDEYSALAQMLLQARVKNVVATMWKIDDDAAAFLAERFYRHLGEGSPATALAMAQVDLARSTRYSHPRFWAAYQFSGNGLPIGAHRSAPVSVQ